MKAYINIEQERCKGCLLCMEFCPKQAIILSNILNAKGYFVASFETTKECNGCATCAVMCPETAIEVYKS